MTLYCNSLSGQKGLQNGGQPLDLRPDAVSGKYGQGELFFLKII